MRISFSDAAQSDLDSASDWYLDEKAPHAAERLADDVDHALTLLGRFPKLGVAAAHQARMLALRHFPYSLIYRLDGDLIRIIALAHHSRRPTYWRGRR